MRANTIMNVRPIIRAIIRRASIEAAVGALCFGGIGVLFSGLSALSGQLRLWDAVAIAAAMFLVGAVVCSACCVLRLAIERITRGTSHEDEVRRFLAVQPLFTVVGHSTANKERVTIIERRRANARRSW